MLSQSAEYALRAVVHLASRPPGEPCTVESIATATRVPIGYLAKIMQQLARGGLTTSQRGLHGGFTLSRDPARISLFDAVDAVHPLRRFLCCPLETPDHRDGRCLLHQELDATLAMLEQRLRQTSIADLLVEAIHPLCPARPTDGTRPPAGGAA